MPLTFRLIFHGLRSIWIAVFLAIAAWLIFVPATQAERAALGNATLADSSMALAQMRVARVVVHFAPERAAKMLSRASGGEYSEEFAGMVLRQLANGPQVQSTPEPLPEDRSAGGAKFVTVD